MTMSTLIASQSLKLDKRFKPHPYQLNFLEHAIDRCEYPGTWNLYSSPTGTGKSIMQLLLLSQKPGGILVTPRLEIINGMLDKCGYDTTDWSVAKTIECAGQHGIYTPIRLRNILAEGKLRQFPDYMIVDECHHDLASSYQDITMYLNGVTKIGLTATTFRGTPKQTRAFLAQWGDEVNVVLSVVDAINDGFCSLPVPEVWNLLDDSNLKLANGEFDPRDTQENLDQLRHKVVEYCTDFYHGDDVLWDRPTMMSVPTVESAIQMREAFVNRGIGADVVTGQTSYADRKRIFDSCVTCRSILIQVNVVSEGVDLPIRRLIDCSPTISPVKWMQQVGRIMRPTKDRQPEYYTICRNLERHCYLMEGAFPNSKIVEAQNAFDSVKIKRSASPSAVRVIGTEGLKRFICTPVKLLNGLTIFTYHLNYQNEYSRSEFFVIIHPNTTDVIYAEKKSRIDPETREITWGKWQCAAEIPPIDGFTSVKMKDGITDKQKAQWDKWAALKGLDPHQAVNNRVVGIVFVLLNLGVRF